MKPLMAGCVLVLLAALPACAQQAPQPPQPAEPPQPDWYVQKKCPAYVDCMPGWDKARAERCKWVKANCPNTAIAY